MQKKIALEDYASESGGCAVTVGTFDGVHRGHREVLSVLASEAAQRGLRPVVITFGNHPLSVLRPGTEPHLVSPPDESIELLRSAIKEMSDGDVRVIPFTRELASITAREWLQRLKEELNARLIVIGFDNTFGSDGRTLTASEYAELGASLGVDVVAAPQLEGVSSTLVRRAVAQGRVEEAGNMLGRPFMLEGTVVHGNALGREIGFPTANIALDYKACLPQSGVYAGMLTVPGGEMCQTVVNVGVRPTVAETDKPVIEAHIIGFKGDVYGSRVRVEFLYRLRGERKFDSIEALKTQIGEDLRIAKRKLAE